MAAPETDPAQRAAAAPAQPPGPEAAVQRRRGPLGWEKRYRSFRQSMRNNQVLDLSWRIAVLSVGVVVLAAGIAMLALPGPGWAAILLGLLILASEFAWARRSLDWARDKALRAKEQALSPEVRRRNQAIAVAVALGVLAGALVYWRLWGFPGPVGEWIVTNIWR